MRFEALLKKNSKKMKITLEIGRRDDCERQMVLMMGKMRNCADLSLIFYAAKHRPLPI